MIFLSFVETTFVVQFKLGTVTHTTEALALVTRLFPVFFPLAIELLSKLIDIFVKKTINHKVGILYSVLILQLVMLFVG